MQGNMLSAPCSCLSWPFSAQTGTPSSLGFSLCWQSHLCVTTKKPNNHFLISFRELLFSALSHSFIPLLKRMQSFTADLPLYCIFVSDNCTVLPSHMICLSLEEIMKRTYSLLPCEQMWSLSKVTSKQQTLNCSCGQGPFSIKMHCFAGGSRLGRVMACQRCTGMRGYFISTISNLSMSLHSSGVL